MKTLVKTIGILFSLILFVLNSTAQELVVVDSISLCSDCEYDSLDIRTDYNGEICALLIIKNDDQSLGFEGALSFEFQSDGWLVWLAPQANWLTIKSKYYLPLRLEFSPVLSGNIYTMEIGTEEPFLSITDSLHAELSMLDASRFCVKDSHGSNCALIRLGLTNLNASFYSSTGGIRKIQYNDGEWWVWMESGSTSLRIECPSVQPLDIEFDSLRSSITYLMTIKRNSVQIGGMDCGAVGFFFDHPLIYQCIGDRTENNLECYNRLEPSNWIFFKQGQFDVDEDQMRMVKAVVTKLKSDPEYTCIVVGIVNWTCFNYSDAYSFKISERLSNIVKALMVDKFGVPENRIETDPKGKSISWGAFGS